MLATALQSSQTFFAYVLLQMLCPGACPHPQRRQQSPPVSAGVEHRVQGVVKKGSR